jgi:hypothetical protein
MSGLLRRIRRPGAAEDTRTEAVVLPEPAHGSAPETTPVRADGSPLPAGVSPEDLERRRRAARPGKVRRRARFLRRARELALRDLGGLVYEAARRDQDVGKLVREKVAHLGVIDSELHALEAELGTPRGETVLREPGVGGTCPRCGELHASDARFCSRCGLDLTAVPAPQQAEAAPEPASPAAGEAVAEPAAGEAVARVEGAAAKPMEPTAGESAEGTEAGEAEEPHRESKRWWRRRSRATSDAPPAEPAPSEATVQEPATTEAPAAPAGAPETRDAAAAEAAQPTGATAANDAEPSEAAAAKHAQPSDVAAAKHAQPSDAPPAAEQPTTDLAAGSALAANGRATKKDALDPERSR